MSLQNLLESVQKNIDEGNIKYALLDLKSAKGMAPDDWRVAYYYGRCYLETGELDKAIDNLKKAHDAQPIPTVSYFLANAYVRNKNWPEAATVAEGALAQEVGDTVTEAALNYILSGANMEQGNLDKAIAAAETAAELQPQDDDYKTHLERLRKAKG
ncbi:MAG: tetratricopeptide repeat protein [Candidatus Lokiarchaeota archaeon]|nr:tetratricopeptide repeat protein [Candidatus Lokiarchaeota archaeon]